MSTDSATTKYMWYPEHTRTPYDSASRKLQYRARFGTINNIPTYEVEVLMKLILRSIEQSQLQMLFNWSIEIPPVTRVEIFNNSHCRHRDGKWADQGLILYDDRQRPVIHIMDALIGYGGSGPILTKTILHELTGSHVVFEEINATYHGILSTDKAYNVVVERHQNNATQEAHWTWYSPASPPPFEDR